MEDVSFQSPVLNKSAQKSRKPIFWIVLIIVIGILILMGFRFIGGKNEKPKEKISPTPTEVIIPTDIPTPTPSEEITPTQGPKATPTSKVTSNPIDKTTGLNRSKLSIVVQNGSGEAGAAGAAASFLKDLGYTVVSTGNADNFNYTNVKIQIKAEKSEFLSLLKKDLGTQYTVGSSSSDLSASASADALVIIGK